MSIHMTKTWFDGEKIVTQEIPEEQIYTIEPLYIPPPQRPWVELTDDELESMAEQYVTDCYFDTLKYGQSIQSKLKEKNT